MMRATGTSLMRTMLIALAVLVITLPAPRLVRAVQDDDGTQTVIHIVAWGETLSQIATRYGVDVAVLVNANNLDQADQIYAGQQLVIPGVIAGPAQTRTATASAHVVQPGETLYGIGASYGVSPAALMETNNLASADQIYAGQTLTIPGSQDTDSRTASLASGSYVVRPGDTLYQIGTRFGLTVSDLVIANNLISPGQIYAGQVLRLPGAANAPLPAYTPQESASIHTVTRGETLTMIAARYGVSPWVLAQTNNLSNPSLLFVGQVLAIPGQHALNPIAAAAPAATRQIVVDVSDQRTYVYQDGQLLWSFLSSTGQPGLDTWRGDFQIQNKIPVAYASTWGITMPNWLGFYWAGSLQNGFHALPIQPDGSRLWEGWLGVPVSYGCVILSDADAQTLYNWAEVGVPVRVQD